MGFNYLGVYINPALIIVHLINLRMSFANAIRDHEARIFLALSALSEMTDADEETVQSFTHRIWEELVSNCSMSKYMPVLIARVLQCIAARLIGLATLNGESLGPMPFLQDMFRTYRPADSSRGTASVNIRTIQPPAQAPTRDPSMERLNEWWEDPDQWTNTPVPVSSTGLQGNECGSP